MAKRKSKLANKLPAAQEGKASVSIKYGDVLVSVQGDSSRKAKKDAIEIFGMLEEKYSAHWGNKVCREKTRFD